MEKGKENKKESQNAQLHYKEDRKLKKTHKIKFQETAKRDVIFPFTRE